MWTVFDNQQVGLSGQHSPQGCTSKTYAILG